MKLQLSIALTLILALSSFGQSLPISLVDIATLTTNTITDTAQITITNFFTNAVYLKTKTNNVQVGDTLYNAFNKVNTDFQIVTNWMGTNTSGGGGSGRTNYILNGNGFGTNITLIGSTLEQTVTATTISATNIATTNLFIGGGLGNNAGSIYFQDGDQILELSQTAGGNIAGDSGLSLGIGEGQIFSEQFSFIAGASNDIEGGNSLVIFGSSIPGGVGNTVGNSSTPVIAGMGNYSTITGGRNNSIGAANFSTIGGGQSNTIGTQYYPAYYGFVAGGFSNTISSLFSQTTNSGSFVAGQSATSTNSNSFVWNDGSGGQFATYTSNTFIISSLNGVAINTNNPNLFGKNGLEVNGNVDTTVGYTINGQPLQSSVYTNDVFITNVVSGFIQNQYGQGTNITLIGTNTISGTYFWSTNSTTFLGFNVSGASAPYTNVNGYYVSATNNNSYFTNGNGVEYCIGSVTNAAYRYVIGYITNFAIFTPTSSSNSIYWSGLNPVGQTYASSLYLHGLHTGPLTISYANLTFSGQSLVSINTNSPGTNTLEVNGWVDSTKGFSVNGIVGTSQNVAIQTNGVGPHGVTLLFTNGLFYGTSNY